MRWAAERAARALGIGALSVMALGEGVNAQGAADDLQWLEPPQSERALAWARAATQRSTEALLGELVGAALEAVETSLPYVRGTHVIATDEQGDPVYEDVGPTPRFLELSRKHLKRMLDEPDAAS